MRIIKSRKAILFYILLLLLICLVGLKSYSDVLRKEGIKELYNTKNRPLALSKFRLAVTLWPFLKFDKSYQTLFGDRKLKTLEQSSAVNIFIKEDANPEDINDLITKLQAVKGVTEVKFISQQEALKIYKEVNKNSPILLELIQPNVLPQSISVYLNDFTIRNQIEKIAKNKHFVTEVIQAI